MVRIEKRITSFYTKKKLRVHCRLRGNQSGFLLMQTIIKTAPTSNFTIYANDLISSDIPPTPKSILLYLLSKPVNWQLKTHDIRKKLGLSAYAVKKALKWLLMAGFAAYTRLKSGHTIWRIFDKPQVSPQAKEGYSPAIPPQVGIPQVENQPALVITETEKIKKPLPAQLIPGPESVVVSDNELIYPVQLTPVQKKAAKHVIRKVKQPELQQPVLFALAYAITAGTVKSPVAYLNGLVSRANNGTFESIQADSGTKAKIPIW